MEKAKVYLFWSPTCLHCPPARDMIHKLHSKRDDFELIEYEPGSRGSQEKFVEFEVVSTPTFIIQGPGHEENIGLRGNQGERVMNKYIDVAVGKQKLNKESSFLDSAKKLFR